MKVGIYVRVSTKSQEDNTSLRNQTSRGIRYCEDNNYDYEVFEDVESATKTNRIRFDDLYEKLKTKEINAIYLSHWDRMVRDLKVLLFFQNIVKETGCILISDGSVRDIIGNEFDSMNYEMTGLQSHWERKQIVRRTNGGKRFKLEQGNIVVGLQGIGYKTVFIGRQKQITIDEKESKIILDLFKTFIRKDCKNYANLLLRMDNLYASKGGLDKRINQSSVKRLLSDKKYLGIKYIKDTYNNETKIYEINIGRIIDDDLFNEVQNKILTLNRSNKRNTKLDSLLRGLVYCKGCGYVMWVNNIGAKEKSYRYFRCYTNGSYNTKNGTRFYKKLLRIEDAENYGCTYTDVNSIRIELLEEVVWEYLFQVLRNTKHLKLEYQKKFNKNKELNTKQTSKLNYYNKEVIKVDKYIARTLDEYITGKIDVEEKNVLLEIQKLKKIDLNIKIDDLLKDINSFDEKKNEVILDYMDYLEVDMEREYSTSRFSDRKYFIDKYLNRIDVEILDNGIKKSKFQSHFNIFLQLKFELDEDDFNKLRSINNLFCKKYNLYVLQSKTIKFNTLIHKHLFNLNMCISVFKHYNHGFKGKIKKIKFE
jgi:DNA invertase Pin-like site-specific DNA recombinase